MKTALVIGEALVDVVRREDGSTSTFPGGSPANVALGLARLGRDVELLTSLGDDAHGSLVSEHLRASGVRLVDASPAASTSVATATLDSTGQASYVFDLDWRLAEDAAPSAHPLVVHTGSIAAVLEPGGSQVEAMLKAARGSSTITYDPNARPALMGTPAAAAAVIERFVSLADVVKVSDEDLEWLYDEPIESVAQRWLSVGPALVVVTKGGDGAFAFATGAGRVDVAGVSVTVTDTVGAGDSFMGGLIDGLWEADLLGAHRREALLSADAETLGAILNRCARIAAITVSRQGANPPNSSELAAW